MKLDRRTYAEHYGPTTGDRIRLAETDLIMAEIQKFDQTSVSGPNVTHDIRWLRAGQEFDL